MGKSLDSLSTKQKKDTAKQVQSAFALVMDQHYNLAKRGNKKAMNQFMDALTTRTIVLNILGYEVADTGRLVKQEKEHDCNVMVFG